MTPHIQESRGGWWKLTCPCGKYATRWHGYIGRAQWAYQQHVNTKHAGEKVTYR